MPLATLTTAITSIEPSQTYALDRTVTRMGLTYQINDYRMRGANIAHEMYEKTQGFGDEI